jgi:hypothetical protein
MLNSEERSAVVVLLRGTTRMSGKRKLCAMERRRARLERISEIRTALTAGGRGGPPVSATGRTCREAAVLLAVSSSAERGDPASGHEPGSAVL